MDLTDQQLKPCKCGYEICVWCWHHIMEMAKKDGSDGRCPACRTPYDKDRIVAMAANCQRLVAEMNSQRRKKMQKLKPKASEGRKHLSDVRVIQRNLVYIIGLPLNLADEDLLQHREYFGRYGKVLKVSISRTATGVIQHSANNSCCVYITYSKEMEAVRCIQSVHCFVLEGRSLRACFGTTKYCHAWLRNVPCSNRDCLYLHDYGSHEDSFTKDELVLAFARSRVQQIIGATNNLHRRSGNILPPPVDDPRHMSSAAKPVAKSPLDKIENQIKGSCSGGGTANSTPLPSATSWVMCVSGSLPPDTSSSCSGNSANRKVEASNDPQPLVSGVASTERCAPTTRRPGEAENSSELHCNGLLAPLEFNQHNIGGNSQTIESNFVKEVVDKHPATLMSDRKTSLAAFTGNDQDMEAHSAGSSFLEVSKSRDFNMNKAVCLKSNRDVQDLCSGLSSININGHIGDTYSSPDADSLPFTHNLLNSSRRQYLLQDHEHCEERLTSNALWDDVIVNDLLNVDNDKPKGCEVSNDVSSGLSSPSLPQNIDQSSHHFWQSDQICHRNFPIQPYEYSNSNEPLNTEFGDHVERKDNIAGFDNDIPSDMGESSIISNILSLELDGWDDSLTLPQSLVKLLGESDDQRTSLKGPTLWKAQDKNQSRFSFARQDEFLNEASDLESSFGISGHAPSKNFALGGSMGNQDAPLGKYQHVLQSSSSVGSDIFASSQSFGAPKFSVPKAHASTPPGFSVSSRAPPGFSCGRVVEQDCNASVKHLQQQYGTPSGNFGSMGDAEFNDPAILEVGKGILAGRLNNASVDMRRNLLPQFSPNEDDARLKLLMQQSISSQNLRYPDHVGNRFSPQNDAYRISPRHVDQLQPNNPSIYDRLHSQQFSGNGLTSNSQWGVWNDAKNFGGLALSEVLNNERLGYNNFVSNYENFKY
ncbi:hypothetical protein L6164_009825 [Bauhinia variegata]|uniref:Uncharacterized protein n=1 Tax=Bauhinia variegata TaxID=167791 RepID=A0ACB9PL72_BAUVA|nr:hypothetical protein L6164_009825 [Bauhinia variegata]